MFTKFSRRYWPIILFLWIIAKLPWSYFLYPLGNILGYIFFFLSRNGKRYNIIQTNLRVLLKIKLTDNNNIIIKHYKKFATALFFHVKFIFANNEWLKRNIIFENIELLSSAKEKPTVIFGLHTLYGFCGTYLGYHKQLSEITVIAQKQRHQFGDELTKYYVNRFSRMEYNDKNSIFSLGLGFMQEKHKIIILAPDQDRAEGRTLTVNFFNLPFKINHGWMHLAQIKEANILYASALMNENKQLVIRLESPNYTSSLPNSLENLWQNYFNWMEEIITKNPIQYFWGNRILKNLDTKDDFDYYDLKIP